MTDTPFTIDVTQENYAEVIETSFKMPVLLDFWASWCQPCLMLTPILTKLAEEYAGKFLLGKLNTEQEQEIAARFGIRSIPTVKLFRNGEPVDEFMGALPEQAVRAFLDQHVARESDGQVATAIEYLAAGKASQAIDLLNEAHQADPENPRVLLALARAQAANGDIPSAETTLKTLPPDMRDKPEAVALRNRLYFEEQVAEAPATAELEARVAADSADCLATYQLAMRRVLEEDYDSAMDLLLLLMQTDRSYDDDAGRRGLLKVFELLGDDPRVTLYRRQMASLLH